MNNPTPADQQPHTMLAADLQPGDRLISLGGIGFAQMASEAAAPALVADLVCPPQSTELDQQVGQLITSLGTFYVALDAPAQAYREESQGDVLLISRRRSLHSRLLAFGAPIRRRTPLKNEAVAAVTLHEWNSAPLIIFDGYLGQETIRALWQRGLPERACIAIVGDDPDDVRLDGRTRACRARAQWVLPYHQESLSALLHAAVNEAAPLDPFAYSNDPFLGILTTGD